MDTIIQKFKIAIRKCEVFEKEIINASEEEQRKKAYLNIKELINMKVLESIFYKTSQMFKTTLHEAYNLSPREVIKLLKSTFEKKISQVS